MIYCQNSYTIQKVHLLIFWQEEWLMGTTLVPEILGQTDPHSIETADFQSIFARSASAV